MKGSALTWFFDIMPARLKTVTGVKSTIFKSYIIETFLAYFMSYSFFFSHEMAFLPLTYASLLNRVFSWCLWLWLSLYNDKYSISKGRYSTRLTSTFKMSNNPVKLLRLKQQTNLTNLIIFLIVNIVVKAEISRVLIWNGHESYVWFGSVLHRP